MANEKRPPSGTPGARRRRPAPTIDLKATEIPAAEATATPAQPEMRPEPAPVQPSPPPPPPPPIPPYTRQARTEPDPPPPPPRPSVTWLPQDLPWPAIAAGATGAACVLALFLVIWLIVPRGGDATASLTPRLAAIETQLRDLAARPVTAPAAATDTEALNALTARLAKLESALNAPRAPVPDAAMAARLGALEAILKPLNDTIGALSRRADEADTALRAARSRADAATAALAELQNTARTSTADHGEIAKLSSRIAALETANRALSDELVKRTAMTGNDRPVRFAVAASALRTTLERGDAYAVELAALRPLTNDTQTLSAIEPFAASGVPSSAALGRELLALLPAMQRAGGTPQRDNGFLDRLQANAERLVRVRPIDGQPGDDPAAILSRVEAKAAHGDIAGTLAELAKLPPATRAPSQPWIATAEARIKAVDSARRLAADAVAALKSNL